MSHTTPLLTLLTPNNRTRAHTRNITPNILRVHPSGTKRSLNVILRHAPQRRQNLQRPSIVTVQRANKKRRVAV
jgi:hypothetical protein